MSDYHEMLTNAISYSGIRNGCLRCGTATNHHTGVCGACRTRKCAHKECTRLIRSTRDAKTFCAAHSSIKRKQYVSEI